MGFSWCSRLHLEHALPPEEADVELEEEVSLAQGDRVVIRTRPGEAQADRREGPDQSIEGDDLCRRRPVGTGQVNGVGECVPGYPEPIPDVVRKDGERGP